ncbi:hypothetical protein I7I50_10149 [Histoplasma capsulatum G186AR]|uniref:Uncharacterized protein n=1 Tax=Ajellomyces capsulatus TaxID=5037 RepID=A0A8H7Z6A2_AJECA|nr:hypothetical protein I7I52_01387 [Histoplasma capsulatum]QSS68999.1 hypothetical protein I7I50_10149 [Histoplasma capsulatum G186AR]
MDEAIPQSWPWFVLNDGGDKMFNPEPTFRKPRLHSTSASTITPDYLAVRKVRQEFCGSEPLSKIHGSFSSYVQRTEN